MISKHAVFVTGGTGFLGSSLLTTLVENSNFQVTALVRRASDHLPIGISRMLAGAPNDFSGELGLRSVEVVIHSAARVHVMSDSSNDPLAEFRKVNVEGTLNLARQAVAAGVKRFIFISSIKVNGEGVGLGRPYAADDTPAPLDPYGVSKMEAEQGLRALASETDLEVVIIRPVLVYGPGVKANFRSMMNWLCKGIPLPLGAIHNKRSLVALDNLVDFIVTCIYHPNAANQTFLVSDGEDLSTTELLRRMGHALGKPARLLPVPASLLSAGAAILGKGAVAQRLCGSLQVDISQTRALLGWTPPVSVDEALRKTAEHYLAQKG